MTPSTRCPPRFFHGAARELIGLYILEGRLDEARRTVWRAYEASDRADRPGILVMRMRAELERIAHEEAVAKLRRYVGTTPDDWEARRALALEEQWAGDQAAANRHMAACLKARPADPVVWRTWLEILDQRGDHDGIQAALADSPPRPAAMPRSGSFAASPGCGPATPPAPPRPSPGPPA